MRIIGLHGKAGSGKDTAFEYIQKWGEGLGITEQRDAFADRLKLSFYRIFHPDCSLTQALAWANEDKDAKSASLALHWAAGETLSSIPIRTALQRYGTEAHRDVFAPDFWISQVLDRDRPGVDILVVTDVRFENEGEAIKDRGGDIWQILRAGSGAGAHASEQPISESLIDMTINNNGSLEGLRANAMSILDAGAVLR